MYGAARLFQVPQRRVLPTSGLLEPRVDPFRRLVVFAGPFLLSSILVWSVPHLNPISIGTADVKGLSF